MRRLDSGNPTAAAKARKDALQTGMVSADLLLRGMSSEIREYWPDGPKQALPDAPHPNEAARKILAILQRLYDEHIGKSWHIDPGADEFAETDLSEEQQLAALERLVDKGLAQHMGQRSYAIARHAIDVADNEARLATLLPIPERAKPQMAPQTRRTSRKIFVVHGRDEQIKLDVVRFLEKLAFDVTLLSEQASKGRTLIEKFEDHSEDAAFAVVLLTPDDVGSLAADGTSKLQPRARQNVVLELGYFVGKLGRKYVCPIRTSDVETPSDLHGLAYVQYDPAGAWKLALAKELEAAELEFDHKKLLG